MYRLPKGLRYSTLEERKEFYTSEFELESLKRWMGNRKNTVFALIVGRHTGIYPEKHKGIRNNTVLIDDYKNLGELKEYILDYLPEGVYYDRNVYESFEVCGKCGNHYRDCWLCEHFLGQELAFDLDPENVNCPYHGDVEMKMKKGQGLSFCMYEFNVVRKQTLTLYDALRESYTKLRIVYSGRGFHIHVKDEDATKMGKKEREKLAAMLGKKYVIDEWVTGGGSRLLRLPYSLHGMVSRVCVPLKINKVEEFNPIKYKKVLPKFCKKTPSLGTGFVKL